jgi:hypothetical protein
MISVVIPLFDKAHTIERTLESVWRQSVPACQVIVVDDGSTDGGGELVQRMAHPRLHVVRQPNRGVSAARNLGIELATSPLIALLDADDEWDETHLADLLETSERFPDAVAVGTAFRRRDARGRIRLQRLPVASHPYLIEDYLGFCSSFEPAFWSSAVAVKRAPLVRSGGFPVGVTHGEDLVTWARLSCEGPVGFCPRVSATYHIRPSSGPLRPAVPDKVSALLVELATHPGASAALGEYLASWHRIRADWYCERDERAACLRELGYAIHAGGPRRRDVLIAASLAIPARLRSVLFDGVRHIKLVRAHGESARRR